MVSRIEGLLDNKDVIVIQSKLGNGKSVLLECIAKQLVHNNNVYIVKNLETFSDDMNYIMEQTNRRNVLLIDDYGYYVTLLKELGKDFPDNVKLIMTCRSAINISLFGDLTDRYHFAEDKIELIDIDEMEEEDVKEIIDVLNMSRLWGRYDRSSYSQKKKLIVRNYGKQVSKIFYLLLESEVIRDDIDDIINAVKSKTGLFDFVLAQAINSICNLKFSYIQIRKYIEISDSLLRSYIVDEKVRELLNASGNEFLLSSSIFAQYLVRENQMKKEMLAMLEKIYRKCAENDETYGKFYQQRRNMVSRSNIILLLNANENKELNQEDEKNILLYYDRIKNLPTATKNPYFWLQFGITALNLEYYRQASIYFDNASTNANKMVEFDTFQIDTHKARLLLYAEMHENSNNPGEAMKTFEDAHKLLLNNSNKGEKMRYVLYQVGRYYEYFCFYQSVLSEENIIEFRKKAFEMKNRFKNFFSSALIGKLQVKLCKAYLNYRKLFEKTEYVLMFIDTDNLYNSKVEDETLKIKC